MKEINDALLQSFRAKVAADPSVSVLNSALAKNDLADLSFVPMAAARHRGALCGGSEDPGHHRPAEIRPVLALCGPEHPAGNRGGKMRPGRIRTVPELT